MKRVLIIVTLALSLSTPVKGRGDDPYTARSASPDAQRREVYVVGSDVSQPTDPYQPVIAVKTNALYLAATSLNAGVEFGFANRWTVDVSALYNPFQLQKESTNQVWFVQPELRYWFCRRFERHFVGVHGIFGEYNIGQVTYLTNTFINHRYEGTAYGAGVSWGYHFPLSGRWAMEVSLGAGYVHLGENKYDCYECDDFLGRSQKNYLGPTKAGLSLIFMIK